ncbi:methyltransferase domain-containing protein [Hungatella hathewayi]|jgi:ubiquinone/menaquinone biosynthesis C-methylase UbiE|uniref:Methyltransferase domain-containing protein n=2 Tax=Lachnospiraceae TaxID=186803 RepID=A0AAW9WES2_9FIRM|nr:methyltransferase domain-containing protein [Hungatella hathewayi]
MGILLRREVNMRIKDLDTLIKENECFIRENDTLEIPANKYEEVSLGKIMLDIENVSKSMEDRGSIIPSNISKANLTASVSEGNFLKKTIKKIDSKLCGNLIYKKHVHEPLKSLFVNFNSNISINCKELLKYNGAEFVDILYRSLLRREPDDNGKQNALVELSSGKLTKLDLINNILYSDEGKIKYVRVKGLVKYNFWAKIKRIIKKIPVLGYFCRLAKSIILAPRYFRKINTSLSLLEQNLNGCRESVKSLEQLSYAGQMDIKKLVSSYEVINNLESQLEHYTEQLKNFVDEQRINEKMQQENAQKQEMLIDQFYLDYNRDLMPDPREEVMEREAVYLPYITEWHQARSKDSLKILDLGCGECEWIELLEKNGYQVTGIDTNLKVIEKAHSISPDFSIIKANAYEYLCGLEDNSIDLITMFHVIEHMTIFDGYKLIIECKRVLSNGGMLILETPNPLNILTATYYFRLDPTHRFPIPKELLEFTVKEAGLNIKETLMLNPLNFIPYTYEEDDPIKDIIFRFNMEQAYSVLAVKG